MELHLQAVYKTMYNPSIEGFCAYKEVQMSQLHPPPLHLFLTRSFNIYRAPTSNQVLE